MPRAADFLPWGLSGADKRLPRSIERQRDADHHHDRNAGQRHVIALRLVERNAHRYETNCRERHAQCRLHTEGAAEAARAKTMRQCPADIGYHPRAMQPEQTGHHRARRIGQIKLQQHQQDRAIERN